MTEGFFLGHEGFLQNSMFSPMKYTLAKKHEMTPKPFGTLRAGVEFSDQEQGRLFEENEEIPGAIDPALVSDWPEIERKFGWLADPEKEGL